MPVQCPATETMHDEVVDVVSCICCGVDETEVRKYRLSDVRLATGERESGTRYQEALAELWDDSQNAAIPFNTREISAAR